jgi:DNA invertase Pin-like site-specific DNA recombinase
MSVAVAYLRVSTKEQGRSGLGLEAQRATIERVAAAENIKILDWFTEVQSGAGHVDVMGKRPQLAAALNLAKQKGCQIIVAKLDRLSRNVHFISGLMVENVDFRCCDLPPEAPKFMLHIFAVLAEWERDQISERVRRALTAAKARGTRLGSGSPKRGASVVSARTAGIWKERYKDALAYAGAGTLREIAARLNASGVTRPSGAPWDAASVLRLKRRCA